MSAASNYEDLRNEKNRIKGILDKNVHIKSHSSWKVLEAKHREIVKQIKTLFKK